MKIIILMHFDFCSSKVVSGGALDVDVIIESPTRRIIYQGQRKELDQFNFNATVSTQTERGWLKYELVSTAAQASRHQHQLFANRSAMNFVMFDIIMYHM